MAGAHVFLSLQETIAFLREFKLTHPAANKADIEEALMASFIATKERSVIPAAGFALRLCEANTGSFSNVVLSLSPFKGMTLFRW